MDDFFKVLEEDALVPVVEIENRAYPGVAWSNQSLLEELQNKQAANLGMHQGGRLIGYWFARIVDDNAHLLNIAIHPDWQGRGLGKELMQSFIDHCVNLSLDSVHCEVRSNNLIAVKLYKSFGFEVIFESPNLYENGQPEQRNGVRMRLVLKP